MISKFKIDRIDAIIEEIAQRILLELEGAKSTDLSDDSLCKKDITFSRHSLCKKRTAPDRN
jgi:hypothetical protein